MLIISKGPVYPIQTTDTGTFEKHQNMSNLTASVTKYTRQVGKRSELPYFPTFKQGKRLWNNL